MAIDLLTAREIARAVPAPLSRVLYVLRARHIRPQVLASQTRLYSPDAIPVVRAALKGIDARRATARPQLTRAERETLLAELAAALERSAGAAGREELRRVAATVDLESWHAAPAEALVMLGLLAAYRAKRRTDGGAT